MRKEIYNDGNWMIKFETNNENFYLYKLNEGNKEKHGDYPSYEKARKAIDRAETIRKKNIAPLPFIQNQSFVSGYKKGNITSIAEVKSYGLYVWVSVDKTRRKESSELLKDTVDNEEILNKLIKLEKTMNEEKEKLVYYSKDEIKKHFQCLSED